MTLFERNSRMWTWQNVDMPPHLVLIRISLRLSVRT